MGILEVYPPEWKVTIRPKWVVFVWYADTPDMMYSYPLVATTYDEAYIEVTKYLQSHTTSHVCLIDQVLKQKHWLKTN